MNSTNVVSLNFKNKEAMRSFLEIYERNSPVLFPEAKILMVIKTTDTSCLSISVYPNDKIRESSRKIAEEKVLGDFNHLFNEDFHLIGDLVIEHIK